ncbi:MAG: response regulator [Pseudomonadota bacterium]
MNWWNRLSYRLTVFLLLLAVVPLAGFGITTLRDIRNVRLSSIAQIHRTIARNTAGQIESSLADMVKEIRLMVDSNEMETLDASDQEWLLQLLIKANPHLYTLTLADAGGRERVKVGRDSVFNQSTLKEHSDLPDFPGKADPAPVVGTIHPGTGNLLFLDLYIPLMNPRDRTVTGVIAAEIDMEKLLGFIADLRVGSTGYVYAVNDKGKFLVYPDHSAVLAGENALQNPLVSDFVAGRDVSDENTLYPNRHQVPVFANARAVTAPKLLVVVTQSVDEAMAAVTRITRRQYTILASTVGIAVLLSLYFTLTLTRALGRLESGARRIGEGDLGHRIPVTSSDELGSVTRSFNDMAQDLQTIRTEADQENWLKQGVVELDRLLRGVMSVETLCTNVVTFMAEHLEAQVGLVYTRDGMGTFRYAAGYAFQPGPGFPEGLHPGEGLPGQAARDKKIIHITDIPEDAVAITAGIASLVPRHLSIVPFVFNDQAEAVMELGSMKALTNLKKRFLSETATTIAIMISGARSRQELGDTLAKTQKQSEELQQQQEELQSANEEMEEQTQLLMASESKLKEQQEELQAANEELEEKTEYLERNKTYIEEKNKALELLRTDLEKKARDLAIASKYKSEFLANMSHELRTPLNSMLLLSRLLADNREGNLKEDQIESAAIIYNSGNDLLSLINEILDLSKIEAGKMNLSMGEIPVRDLGDVLEKTFRGITHDKGLSLDITIRDSAPSVIVSDPSRIQQVLKNFMANAIKFTERGGICVDFYRPDDTVTFSRSGLAPDSTIAIAVSDTGIGIPEDKQKIIFEAFQQVEGGSARKYGGTGLGLSISRELANLLGGEIQLRSLENAGSTFTLFLPTGLAGSAATKTAAAASRPLPPVRDSAGKTAGPGASQTDQPESSDDRPVANPLSDDRDNINPGDKTLLIIEDDAAFAATLRNFCKGKGFKVLVSLTGEEGLKLAGTCPLNAIILDIHLPGMDGWAVLEILKENPATRHIPVHFMSVDDPVPEAFTKGAVGYLTKPVSREDLEGVITNLKSIINKTMKDLLLVEDNANQRHAITRLISDTDVAITEVSTGSGAIAALRGKCFDCMILDLGLPDMSGFDLLKKMETDDRITLPPVVVYTGKELTAEEEKELRKYSESIIIKGARSEERLLDETSLFLHRMVEKMPEEKRKMISALHDLDQVFRDRTILIVDDDMRNVFALAKVLGNKGMKTLKAENGIKALEILDQGAGVDLVLMDIMMPVMDGYETMKKIRSRARFGKLPIIALTAKAMQRDKDDCIAAGANDYLAKPVDMERLLSMLRVWLYR